MKLWKQGVKRVNKQIHKQVHEWKKKGIGGNLPPMPNPVTADTEEMQAKWTKGSSQAYVTSQSNIFSPLFETE